MSHRGEHHFAHWFLYSNAYDTWRALDGWFEEGEGSRGDHSTLQDPGGADGGHGRQAKDGGVRR